MFNLVNINFNLKSPLGVGLIVLAIVLVIAAVVAWKIFLSNGPNDEEPCPDSGEETSQCSCEQKLASSGECPPTQPPPKPPEPNPEVSALRILTSCGDIINCSDTERVYLLVGFGKREKSLKKSQKDWLEKFYASAKACPATEHGKFRLMGFASSEEFQGDNVQGEIARYKHLCQANHKDKNNSKNSSDVNNCFLANIRLGNTAAYLESMGNDACKISGEDGPDCMLRKMDEYCKDKGSGDLPLSTNMTIAPWCKLGDMMKIRFRFTQPQNKAAFDDDALYFLNRSVRITTDSRNSCPMFRDSTATVVKQVGSAGK